MVFLQFRHRAKRTDSSPILLELDRYQANKKMCFDEIGFGAEQPLAALGCFVNPACSQEGKPLSKRVLHPGCRPYA
jgi:hypothetical protein